MAVALRVLVEQAALMPGNHPVLAAGAGEALEIRLAHLRDQPAPPRRALAGATTQHGAAGRPGVGLGAGRRGERATVSGAYAVGRVPAASLPP